MTIRTRTHVHTHFIQCEDIPPERISNRQLRRAHEESEAPGFRDSGPEFPCCLVLMEAPVTCVRLSAYRLNYPGRFSKVAAEAIWVQLHPP